jgi:hypothetical protein
VVAPHRAVGFALCGVLAMVGTLLFPALSALMSAHCTPAEQGGVQGALHGAQALAQGAGLLLFPALYRVGSLGGALAFATGGVREPARQSAGPPARRPASPPAGLPGRRGSCGGGGG